MRIRKIFILLILTLSRVSSFAQNCQCEMEFRYIKKFIELNYAGFKDKKALLTDRGYDQLVSDYLQYSKGPHSTEKCLLIIAGFLDHFKDEHVQIRANFDATKSDSSFIRQRELIGIPDKTIAALRQSVSVEGVYLSRYDSSYRIAVMRDKTPYMTISV